MWQFLLSCSRCSSALSTSSLTDTHIHRPFQAVFAGTLVMKQEPMEYYNIGIEISRQLVRQKRNDRMFDVWNKQNKNARIRRDGCLDYSMRGRGFDPTTRYVFDSSIILIYLYLTAVDSSLFNTGQDHALISSVLYLKGRRSVIQEFPGNAGNRNGSWDITDANKSTTHI